MAVKKGLDLSRIASAVQRPGIDPRINLTYAIVEDVAFDPEHGMFADVQFTPDTQRVTALVGSMYSGPGFGQWPGALRKGDLVLVAVPMGDPAFGSVVLSKVWSASSPPPPEFGDADSMDPTDDPVVVVEAGKTLRIVAKEGANIKLEVSGAGQVAIAATDGATVNVTSDDTIALNAPTITVGGGAPLARVGDLVALSVPLPSPATPTTVVGQIVSGSSRAKG